MTTPPSVADAYSVGSAVASDAAQAERDAYVIPEGFESWKTPDWRNETPHPLCHVTREQYPDPRECAFVHSAPLDDGYEGPCHLGHPANCRGFVNTTLQDERRKR